MDILFFDRRPMLLFCIMIVCGVYTATGNSTGFAIITAILVVTGALIGKTRKKHIITALVLGLMFFFYGNICEKSFDNQYKEFDGVKCTADCTVTSVGVMKPEYTLVTVRPKGFLKKKIKVYLMDNQIELIQGDHIFLRGVLHKPTGATNPGGYDARKVQFSDGIAAYMFANSDDYSIGTEFSPGHIFGLLRKDIKDSCIGLLGYERGNILVGMMIGDKTNLDETVQGSFRDSGLSHTMAVSGAHVAYILAPLIFLFSKLGIDRRRYYPWLLAVLLFFALLTGFTPSVARATLTAGLMLIAGIFSNETEPLNSLALSAVILILMNPFCIYDAGFILSYISVASILIFYPMLLAITGKSPIMRILALTLAVQIGILPATAKLFYSVQVFSVISNMLIFPIRAVLAVTGWIMYLISIVFMPLAQIVSLIPGILTDSTASVAELFGTSVFSAVSVPYIPPWLVLLYITGIYFSLHFKRGRLIPITAIVVVVTFYMMFFAVPKNTFVFFDSGQADCFLIKTDKKRDIIIDTGKYALSNSLAHFCGDYIDMIFLTHAHQDHIGGLEAILERFRVGVVFIPGCKGAEMSGVRSLCTYYDVPCIGILAGNKLNLDGYEILVLNPSNVDNLALNDTSIVLKLNHGDKSLLYCGDIEMPAEISMIGSGCNLEADIFKVPHHGAVGSAYSEFFNEVSPKIAIISCGTNYFGHPSKEALNLLESAMVFRTDRDGAVIIKLKRDGFEYKICRNQTITK